LTNWQTLSTKNHFNINNLPYLTFLIKKPSLKQCAEEQDPARWCQTIRKWALTTATTWYLEYAIPFILSPLLTLNIKWSNHIIFMPIYVEIFINNFVLFIVYTTFLWLYLIHDTYTLKYGEIMHCRFKSVLQHTY
jgi:hypothetical protein